MRVLDDNFEELLKQDFTEEFMYYCNTTDEMNLHTYMNYLYEQGFKVLYCSVVNRRFLMVFRKENIQIEIDLYISDNIEEQDELLLIVCKLL